MTSGALGDFGEEPITGAEIEEIDAWRPEVPSRPSDEGLAEVELRRLLLCLEIAVRDCRDAASKVSGLLPAMNAVARHIGEEAGSQVRTILALCAGALSGFAAAWLLLGGAW